MRDMVEALTHISKWDDVRVVPELSAHEKKKLEAQRRHAAKVAEQRRLKAARAAQKQACGAGGAGGRRGTRGRSRRRTAGEGTRRAKCLLTTRTETPSQPR